ncbi:MAG: Fe(3+) ABC transporter substrate-binding protein [Scytolyngbya sp. HA4215-MV1]|jgi:iron(III) transport system substrate-binding protein|nr:Fe(3+) ABC transporter substrate-binding protein [Scytolyngbya sp. HA4215-MV1]
MKSAKEANYSVSKISRRVFLAAGGAVAVVALHRIVRRNSTTISSNDRIVNLYSARHYDTDTAIYESFTAKTGIKVNLVEAEADKLIERIKSEGANSPADVLITVDAGRLWRAQEAGILQPIASPTLMSLPQNLYEPQGHWFGLTKRARVIVYNKARVKESDLSTYEDLANPKWKGRIVIRSSTNVYNQSLVGSILAALGPVKTEAWAKGIVANLARAPEGNDTAQIKAVAAGLADVAIVNQYYLLRLAQSKKPEEQEIVDKVGIFFPNQNDRGTHINISGGGVVKTAPHREAAIQFLEYLASKDAQAIFAKGNYEYPALEGVTPDTILASYSKNFKKEDSLNAAVYGRNNAEALKIMDRAGWK